MKKIIFIALLGLTLFLVYFLIDHQFSQKNRERLRYSKSIRKSPSTRRIESYKPETDGPNPSEIDRSLPSPANPESSSKGAKFFKLATENTERAIDFLEHWLLEVEPGDYSELLAIGAWLEENQQEKVAFEVWRRLMDIDESNREILWRLVNNLQKQGRANEAQELILDQTAKVENAAQKTEIYRLLAEEMTNLNGPEATIDFLKEAVNKNPGNPALATDLGLALIENKNFEEAKSLFEQQLEKDPKDPEALFGMGILQSAQGDFNKAEKYFQYNLSVNPDHLDSKFNLAELYTFDKKTNPAVAEQHYQDLLQQIPENLEAQNGLAAVYLQTGRTEQAIDLWRQLAESNPTESVVHSNLGEAYLKSGRFEEASKASDHALAADPDNAEAYYFKALAEKEMGNQALYEQYYQQALQRNPDLGSHLP